MELGYWMLGDEEEFSGNIIIWMGGTWQLSQLCIMHNHYPNAKTDLSRKIHPTLLYDCLAFKIYKHQQFMDEEDC